MLMQVLRYYKSPSNYENPIELIRGETVKVGEITEPNSDYPNWVFCTCERTGRTGWVAAGVLDIDGELGTVTEDYTSKEMLVNQGEIVDALYKLNGWYWCKRQSDGETGWVDKGNLTAEIKGTVSIV